MIQYSEICEQDVEQVKDLYEMYLNSGKYIRDSIQTAFESKDYVGYKACAGDKIVGFFAGQAGVFFTYPHPEVEKEILEFAGNKKIYNPDALVVLPQYRNQGIAGELIRRMKKNILAKKADLALVELWVYPDQTVPAQKPLLGLGKAVYEKVISRFYQDLHKYGVKCPLCGDKCNCSALIQLLEVK